MSILRVETYPSEILRKVAKPVDEVTPDLVRLIQDMIETMYKEEGVGLAAPQIGVSKRIIIASPQAKPGTEKVYLNPEITKKEGKTLGLEGCLSLPGIAAEVNRATKITFTALDLQGNKITVKAEDFFARIIQHEIDHLDGKLFIDHVAFSERKELLDSLKKNLMIG
ncbi:MAG: peptide deformylase [Candidatus Omnitrophica bacterium]|nr:peptide deformylase [Candidatus Omnitrophota bacterium]